MSDSNIEIKLQEDMKTAMRARDKERLGVIRFIIAAIKRYKIDYQTDLDDAKALTILEKLVKQHHDAITQYDKAGRTELADKERFELTIIQKYMPEPLSDEAVSALIKEAISETSAASIRDMGKVMQYVKVKAEGRADMQQVSRKVKDILG